MVNPENLRPISIESNEELLKIEYQFIQLNKEDWGYSGFFNEEDAFLHYN